MSAGHTSVLDTLGECWTHLVSMLDKLPVGECVRHARKVFEAHVRGVRHTGTHSPTGSVSRTLTECVQHSPSVFNTHVYPTLTKCVQHRRRPTGPRRTSSRRARTGSHTHAPTHSHTHTPTHSHTHKLTLTHPHTYTLTQAAVNKAAADFVAGGADRGAEIAAVKLLIEEAVLPSSPPRSKYQANLPQMLSLGGSI